MFKKIAMFYSVAVTAAVIGFFGGKITTENRLVEQHRQQLELLRSRNEQYEDTYRRAAETNRELGECLSRTTTTISGLRSQISEVRTRYEKMEELLSGVGRDDSDAWNIDGGTDSVDEGKISDE